MVNIGHFVPPHLKREFYHGVKGRKGTRHNGLDPYGWTTEGLVLYLPLWALKGDGFKSVDAYKHTCTNYQTLWTPHGRDFDGADDYIKSGNDIITEAQLASGATVMAWVKLDTLDDAKQKIIAIEGRCDLLVRETTDLFRFDIYDGATHALEADDKGAISTATWYHAAGTWDATDMRVYVDAVADATTLASNIPSLTAVNRPTVLGASYALISENLDGLIGEVWIYGRALSAGEITQIYNSTGWRYQ